MAIKLILSNKQALGDALMLTAAVRDLHLTYPGVYLTDIRTPHPEIWLHNPYVTRVPDSDPEAVKIDMKYPLYLTAKDQYAKCCYHFAHGFRKFLEDKIAKPIRQTRLSGDIHLSSLEKLWPTSITKNPYWLINAGGKSDFTNKIWELERFREVVRAFPKTQFIQVGALRHLHETLAEPNVINLLGQTNVRDLIRLVRFSIGIITPVSALMHLSAAIDVDSTAPSTVCPLAYFTEPSLRPCIVIAGGRENSVWERYPGHYYISREGMLPCCLTKPCWTSRVIPLNDGDSKDNNLCACPVKTKSGQVIPKCLDMIQSDEVIYAMKLYGAT